MSETVTQEYAVPGSLAVNHLSNETKVMLYNKNGLNQFYCSDQQPHFISLNDYDNVKTIVSFRPNHVDQFCTSIENSSTNDLCKNFFIDNYSCNDPNNVSYKEKPCPKSISNNISADPNNCLIRILSNNYRLLKRCVSFDFIKMTMLNNRKIRVDIIGDVSTFVLSRPLFISFGSYGLFKIEHDYDNGVTDTVNMFVNFSNTTPSNPQNTYAFFMSPVTSFNDKNTNQEILMYPNNTNTLSITDVFENKNDGQAYPITIYYLSYLSPISPIPAGIQNNNCVSITFSKDAMDTGNNQQFVFSMFPSSSTSASTLSIPSSVTVVFNKQATNPYNIFVVNVNMGGSDVSYRPQEGFGITLMKLYNQGSRDFDFHVNVTYCLDILLITTFVREKDTNNVFDECTTKRYIVSNGTSRYVMNYDVGLMQNTLNIPTNEKIKNATIAGLGGNFNVTAIPNIALMANYLGYNINANRMFVRRFFEN